MKKLQTQKGNWLLFDESLKLAVYTANGHESYRDDSWVIYPRILKVIKNGQREWDWASETWGVEPQEMEEAEKSILLHANAGVETLAIKNSKGESWIFQQSPFFKTATGYLICRGYGTTRRSYHQGGNGFELYNIEQYREVSESKSETPYAVFGTYGGWEETYGVHEGDLIPITQSEWEKLSGRKYFPEVEFHWFQGPGVTGVKTGSCTGIIKEGDYIFRHTFEEHRKNGRYGVYRDGSFDMLPTKKVDSPFGEIYMAEDGDIRIFFGRFKFFNLRTVWVGYESTGEPLSVVFSQLKRKVADKLQYDLNYKLRRNSKYQPIKEAIAYFKKLGKFEATPRDSWVVGNCAYGTWEWMKETFGLPEAENVSWDNFPIPTDKKFRIPVKNLKKLMQENYAFESVVIAKYKRANPTMGELTTEQVEEILFSSSIYSLVGNLITEKELKYLGLKTKAEIQEEENERMHALIKEKNAENQQKTTLGDLFPELLKLKK